jgi:hypothetical protein
VKPRLAHRALARGVLAALALVTLAVPRSGRAQAGGMSPEVARPLEPAASGSSRAQPPPPIPEPAVHFVVFGGYDIGSTQLVSADMKDGSSQSISANQGLTASIGLATLKLFDGRLATQATIGIEGWSIDASNGHAEWRAYPLDVMEFAYLDPIRLGAGISYLLNPSLTGTGLLSALDVRFKNSLGFAFEADWVFRMGGSRSTRMTLGARYALQNLETTSGRSGAIDASSFAILVGYTG